MTILGIDEVGRGPLAGPLVIGAVVLPEEKPAWVADLRDSKKLSAKKRKTLSEKIEAEAPVRALGWVTPAELDQIGMSEALKLAARRAVKMAQIQAQKNHTKITEIIIDGNINFLAGTPFAPYTTTIIKGDDLIKEISAASIFAKVARDEYMIKIAETYPEYGFESHVGYGTQKHFAALDEFGPCPEHRFSLKPLQKFFSEDGSKIFFSDNKTKFPEPAKKPFTSKSSGNKAESIVANFLESEGHEILARNHKTKFYEIDIISLKSDKIYFTEVKYRRDQSRGTSLAQITPEKLRQMTFAAESYLKFRPDLKAEYSPLLAAAAVSGADFHLDDWFPIV